MILFKHESHPAASGPLHLPFFAELPLGMQWLTLSLSSGFGSDITSSGLPGPLFVTRRAVSVSIAHGPGAVTEQGQNGKAQLLLLLSWTESQGVWGDSQLFIESPCCLLFLCPALGWLLPFGFLYSAQEPVW